MLVNRYKEQSSDLLVPPELLATNDVFAQYKNLLEICRQYHNGTGFPREGLDECLDNLDAIVQAMRSLAEERYA
jgi:hypothetical protein